MTGIVWFCETVPSNEVHILSAFTWSSLSQQTQRVSALAWVSARACLTLLYLHLNNMMLQLVHFNLSKIISFQWIACELTFAHYSHFICTVYENVMLLSYIFKVTSRNVKNTDVLKPAHPISLMIWLVKTNHSADPCVWQYNWLEQIFPTVLLVKGLIRQTRSKWNPMIWLEGIIILTIWLAATSLGPRRVARPLPRCTPPPGRAGGTRPPPSAAPAGLKVLYHENRRQGPIFTGTKVGDFFFSMFNQS